MRHLAVLLLLAPLCPAADPPKPALTAKQLADGWVLLFDGESTYGWDTKGDVTAKDGKLVVGEKSSCTTKVTLPPGEVRVDNLGRHLPVAPYSFDKPVTAGLVAYKPADTKPIFKQVLTQPIHSPSTKL